jgi:hypothetical protein
VVILETLITNVPIPSGRIMMMKNPTTRKTIKRINPNTKNYTRKRRTFTPKKTIDHLK